jgi:ubiquinol-cytochrome c reductase cytochrome c subunit
MVTGPQALPVFNDTTITPEEKRDMIAYITQVRSQKDPGGFGLGRIGPVTEGLVAWVVGLSALALAAIWITAKKRQKP